MATPQVLLLGIPTEMSDRTAGSLTIALGAIIFTAGILMARNWWRNRNNSIALDRHQASIDQHNAYVDGRFWIDRIRPDRPMYRLLDLGSKRANFDTLLIGAYWVSVIGFTLVGYSLFLLLHTPSAI